MKFSEGDTVSTFHLASGRVVEAVVVGRTSTGLLKLKTKDGAIIVRHEDRCARPFA